MARRRKRRRKSVYEEAGTDVLEGPAPPLDVAELSPRARRLIQGGVIDLAAISGSGKAGRVTSGDILHAARIMEMEQSVARIEVAHIAEATDPIEISVGVDEVVEEVPDGDEIGSTTFTAVAIGGEPVSVEPTPWDDYNGSTESLAEGARPGAEQSWGEAEANLAAMADEAADRVGDDVVAAPDPTGEEEIQEVPSPMVAPEPGQDVVAAAPVPLSDVGVVATPAEEPVSADSLEIEPMPMEPMPTEPEPDADSVPHGAAMMDFGKLELVDPLELVEPEGARPGVEQSWGGAEAYLAAMADEAADRAGEDVGAAPDPTGGQEIQEVPSPVVAPEPGQDVVAPVPLSDVGVVATPAEEPVAESVPHGKAMMDFGTLEPVDPESVWAEGAREFAPWFLAHSRQLGDVLGLEAGLSEARQFTTRTETGVLALDDNGESVLVISSKSATAEDSDLGRALGMAASSGAASVALVTASFGTDQLKALAWLNNQTRSSVKWYGIELRVLRIGDSPAAMLFDLVAAPPPRQ